MYNFILNPHTISALTLTSVRRNNVLQWAHSFLHFFKIRKIDANDMQNLKKKLAKNSKFEKKNKQQRQRQRQRQRQQQEKIKRQRATL